MSWGPRLRPLFCAGLLLGLAALILGLTALASQATVARAQPRSELEDRRAVVLEAAPLFGSESVPGGRVSPLAITLTNRTRQTLRGELLVEPVAFRQRAVPFRTHVDLPPGAARVVQVDLPMDRSHDSLRLRYSPSGHEVQEAEVSLPGRGGQGVVVLADPPRLRGHLHGHLGSSGAGSGGMSRGMSRTRTLAEVSFDPASGDPQVPERAEAWSNYMAIFATVSEAERLEGAGRQALIQHVHAGARLVLVPHSAADCAAPIVRELLGPVECAPIAEAPGFESPHPSERAMRFRPVGDEHTLEQPFGVSRAQGFGTVFLLGWDANAADADPLATQDVWRAVELHLERNSRPHRALGELPSDETSVRTALDPNESFRPALGLVAILLLLYVFAIGPLNFRYVDKGGRPTAALVTTPLIALGCLVLMAITAYVSKGVVMRYRALDVLELASGQSVGIRTRYVGHYLTRPRTFAALPSEDGRVSLIHRSSGGSLPVTEQHERGIALVGIRGGLWETVATQDQSVVDTEGGLRVVLERDPAGLGVTVTNLGRLALAGTIYMNEVGDAYLIGDLAPGQSRVTPTAPVTRLDEWIVRAGRGHSEEVESVCLAMGLTVDDAAMLRAALSVIRDGASREGVWARLPASTTGAGPAGFSLEWEHRLVFVAARHDERVPLHLVPAPVERVEPDETWAPEYDEEVVQ